MPLHFPSVVKEISTTVLLTAGVLRGEAQLPICVSCYLARSPANVSFKKCGPCKLFVSVFTSLTVSCLIVFQNGFSGESFGRSPHLCVTSGLHYSWCLRGSQIPQCVSTRLLDHTAAELKHPFIHIWVCKPLLDLTMSSRTNTMHC